MLRKRIWSSRVRVGGLRKIRQPDSAMETKARGDINDFGVRLAAFCAYAQWSFQDVQEPVEGAE